ncbi:MAG TPA: S8 family serine peptidase [Thermoanaerobaculia bacterium]|nr:S8 family serine peptidase [Thermoanaerobaculia bacterium]
MRRLLSICSLILLPTLALADEPSSAELFARDHIGRFAARHMVLDPQHALRDFERAELEAMGVTVQRALTNGRLLVRIAPDSTFTADDPRVRSLTPLTLDQKVHHSAWREVAKMRSFAQLDVMFHDDVTLAAAQRAIAAAGGTIEEPLTIELSRVVPVRIPTNQLQTLANDENVLMVRGRWRAKQEANNSVSAQLSGVDVIQAAPYGLTGQGVVLSYFELSPGDQTHSDFGGRFTHDVFTPCAPSCSSDSQHPTHVAGTMIGSGAGNARAKGMAPGATLHQFSTYSGNPNSVEKYFSDKETKLKPLGVVADNNSWGYVLGWSGGSPFIWNDTEEYYGAYDGVVTAPIDQITRSSNVLFVHSAGNDGQKTGPNFTPFPHEHVDDEGEPISAFTYCYSEDGTGNDCPVPTCSAGPAFCEITRHPFNLICGTQANCAFGSIGVTASAKNSVAVGATDGSKNIASYSSRGPSRDGRVKPDLTSRGGIGTLGGQVVSTLPNNSYGGNQGTSMASPVVTGIAALFVEQWRKSFGGATPTPDVIKTTLIAGAEDRGNAGPDYTYGFGFIDAKAAVDLVRADANTGSRIRVATLAQGETVEIPLTVSTTQNLRVVLGWSDPEVLFLEEEEVGDPAIVNDLDVKVIDAGGNTVLPYVLDKTSPNANASRGVNVVDNTEEVEIANAAPGTYRVVVTGKRITVSSPQRYVLVANAALGAAVAPCIDVREPNDTTATAFGNLVDAEDVNAKLCSASDVDVYKFRVNKAGTVSVLVTPTDTPLRVTLTSSATAPVSIDVPAATPQTLAVSYTNSVTVDFFVEVKALNATIGSNASYTIRPTYPFTFPTRRRTTRH